MVAMSGQLKGLPINACAFEFNFMGGSMGRAVGQKFVAAEQSLKVAHPWCASQPPVVLVCKKPYLV